MIMFALSKGKKNRTATPTIIDLSVWVVFFYDCRTFSLPLSLSFSSENNSVFILGKNERIFLKVYLHRYYIRIDKKKWTNLSHLHHWWMVGKALKWKQPQIVTVRLYYNFLNRFSGFTKKKWKERETIHPNLYQKICIGEWHR